MTADIVWDVGLPSGGVGHCKRLAQRCTRISNHPFEIRVMSAMNVLGTPLQACSYDPLTGFLRDGCCKPDAHDHGTHVVCAKVTADFLAYSLTRGNDLMTPRPEYRFAGLRPGDRWCLCVNRWLEALHAGVAPPVHLEATHAKALEKVSLERLREHAL
jgi:uncharacterized protein (DUF2237 family)